MPNNPFLVRGDVTNSSGSRAVSALVKFTTTSGSKIEVTDSNGEFLIDIGNIGYTDGETVSVYTQDEFLNEESADTFVVGAGGTTLNITTSIRDGPLVTGGNRIFQLANIGGKIITNTNPLPVTSPSGSDIALDGYKINDVDADASPNYYGFTDKAGNWFILKEIISAGADTYRYSKGSGSYTINWSGRVLLSYDYYYNTF